MGIPGLIQYLRRHHGSCIETKRPSNYDLLLIDGNCQLYKVVTNGIVDTNYTTSSHSIIMHFGKLISSLPTKEVYIALDGVPPRAKLEEQKKRRVLRSQADKEFYNIYEKVFLKINRKLYESNFTLGTITMTEISENLGAFCQSNNYKFSPIQAIGEGEQKVFLYMRNQGNRYKSFIVNSGDCDIILLGLLFMYDYPDKNLYFHIDMFGKDLYINIHKLFTDLGTNVLIFVFSILLFGSDFYMGINTQCIDADIINYILSYSASRKLEPIKKDVNTTHLYLHVPDVCLILNTIADKLIHRNDMPPAYIFYDLDEYNYNNKILFDESSSLADLELVLGNQYNLYKSKKSPSDICLSNDCKMCTEDEDMNTMIQKSLNFIKMFIWTLNYMRCDILDHGLVYTYPTGPHINYVQILFKSANKSSFKLVQSSVHPLSYNQYVYEIKHNLLPHIETPYCGRHPIKSKYQAPVFLDNK